MSRIVDLRNEVYTRILLKKTLEQFSDNDFAIEQTWMPYSRLESLLPTPKVWIVGGSPGDAPNRSRTNTIMREFCVMIGLQKALPDKNFDSEVDDLCGLLEEIEDTCRLEVTPDQYSFNRLEYLKDENNVPLSFIMLRRALCFEAYFSIHYNLVIP